jgi:hypothetical protein
MKAAELSALARRFRALATSQLEEGQVIDAVAAQATLAQTEPPLPISAVAESTETQTPPGGERVS